MPTLREILTKSCELEGFDTDDESLEEHLREGYEVVWTGDHDEHRWRTEYTVVSQVGDRFFQYSSYIGKSEDGDAESCGYTFEGIDHALEVYPHEVMTIIYKNTPAK